ncbi:hypothetical protein BpHYR1_017915 [Brachionus plicatilis]|uniref:Uncharacterized protein n=1 Tax=Brachionus plicatilis TaxID=10195 RepID=A0A3M7SX31_BRAPC|nr:hypothetical protein BpHYR1_017915 [Brachionus plicatilis]
MVKDQEHSVVVFESDYAYNETNFKKSWKKVNHGPESSEPTQNVSCKTFVGKIRSPFLPLEKEIIIKKLKSIV